jgi:hypothetical protein
MQKYPRRPKKQPATGLSRATWADRSRNNYFLRWRIRARIRRFLRPIFRRPLPVFFVPTDVPLLKPINESLPGPDLANR